VGLTAPHRPDAAPRWPLTRIALLLRHRPVPRPARPACLESSGRWLRGGPRARRSATALVLATKNSPAPRGHPGLSLPLRPTLSERHEHRHHHDRPSPHSGRRWLRRLLHGRRQSDSGGSGSADYGSTTADASSPSHCFGRYACRTAVKATGVPGRRALQTGAYSVVFSPARSFGPETRGCRHRSRTAVPHVSIGSRLTDVSGLTPPPSASTPSYEASDSGCHQWSARYAAWSDPGVTWKTTMLAGTAVSCGASSPAASDDGGRRRPRPQRC